MKVKILLLVYPLLTSAAWSMSINLSAATQNLFGNSSGSQLAIGNLVEVGTYESGIFSPLGSASIGTGTGIAGTISFTTPSFDSTADGIVGDQIAVRYFNDTVVNHGDYGLVLLDGNQLAEWFVKATAPGPTPNQNQIELANLTDATGTGLVAGASIIRGSFGPESDSTTLNNPLFKTAVPEPSAFAAVAGLAVIGFASLRRRR